MQLIITLLFLLLSFHLNAQGNEKVKIQLPWKHQFEFAGFYAAVEKGYYQDEGIDVELIEFDHNKDIIQSVINQQVHYGVGYSSIIAAYLQGKPVVFLANFFKRSPLAIAVQPEINSPRDLKNKKIMGLSAGMDHITLQIMLNKFKISLNSLNIIPPSFSIKEFKEKQIDAMVIYTTNEAVQLQQQGVPFKIFNPSVYGTEFYDDNLFTSRHELNKHPARVKKIRSASIRGWQYALKHQTEMVDLILEKYNTQQKSRDELLLEAAIIEDLIMDNIQAIGSINEDRILLMARDLMENNILPANTSLDFEKFIYKEPQGILKLTQKEQAYLNKKNDISYCADPDWMPYEKIENNVHIGMSADYLKLFSGKINTPLKLVPTKTWSEAIEYAKARKCDLFSLAMATPERKVYMNFTKPYITFPLVIAARNDELFISDINTIKNKPLGIVKDYAYVEILKRRYPGINLVEVNNLKDGVQRVINGELFGFIDNLATIGYNIQKSFVGEVKIAGKFDEKWELGIGVRNDDPVLLTIMEKVVNATSTEENQVIHNKWLSVKYDKLTDYDLVIKVFLVLSIIIALIVLRYYIQSRYINQLKIANQKIQLQNEQLKILSSTDKLTGLFNRLKLDEILKNQLHKFNRYHELFSVILLDIDHFKNINDEYGHLSGDEALKTLAGILSNNCRQIDEIGRWGGEEFLIICPHTNLHEAHQLAEKLRIIIESTDYERIGHFTASFGVAMITPGSDITKLLNHVDNALYQAKESGRNQVCLSD